MKKSIMLVIAFIMLLGSVRAMAGSDSEGDFCMDCWEQQEGRITAAQIEQIRSLRDRVDKLIDIAAEKDSEALQETQLGQLSSLTSAYVSEAEESRSASELDRVYSDAMKIEKDVIKIERQLKK